MTSFVPPVTSGCPTKSSKPKQPK